MTKLKHINICYNNYKTIQVPHLKTLPNNWSFPNRTVRASVLRSFHIRCNIVLLSVKERSSVEWVDQQYHLNTYSPSSLKSKFNVFQIREGWPGLKGVREKRQERGWKFGGSWKSRAGEGKGPGWERPPPHHYYRSLISYAKKSGIFLDSQKRFKLFSLTPLTNIGRLGMSATCSILCSQCCLQPHGSPFFHVAPAPRLGGCSALSHLRCAPLTAMLLGSNERGCREIMSIDVFLFDWTLTTCILVPSPNKQHVHLSKHGY